MIKVFEKRKKSRTPLAKVSDMIKERLEPINTKEMIDAYLVEQREVREIEIFLENVVDNPKFNLTKYQPKMGADAQE